MQLLTMAMQSELEDSNGNDTSDVGTAQASGAPASQHPQQRQQQQQEQDPLFLSQQTTAVSSPYIFRLEDCPESDARDPPQQNFVPEMGPGNQLAHTCRPDQLFCPTDPPYLSPVLCKDSVCSAASSGADSDSSSSPDINSNTLIVGFGKTELTTVRTDRQGGTSQADKILSQSGQAPFSKGHEPEEDLNAVPGRLETIVYDELKKRLKPGERESENDPKAVLDFQEMVNVDDSSGNVIFQRVGGRRLVSSTGDRDTRTPSYSSQEGCGSESQTQPAGTQSCPPPNHPNQSITQSIILYPTSTDKNAENLSSTIDTKLFSGATIFSPIVPQHFPQAGPAGGEGFVPQPRVLSDAVCNNSHQPAKVSPVSVLNSPPVTESQVICEDSFASSLLLSPPIWTTLAMLSVINKNIISVPSGAEYFVTDSSYLARNEPKQTNPVSSQDDEAKMAACIRAVSLSPKLLGHHSVSKRFSPYRHHSLSPFTTACNSSRTGGSPSQSLTGLQRVGHEDWGDFELRRPSGLVESVLEDECASYTTCLIPCAGDKTSFDRTELLPDPVATTLTDGDTMHFLPILEDTVLNPGSGFQDSVSSASFRPG